MQAAGKRVENKANAWCAGADHAQRWQARTLSVWITHGGQEPSQPRDRLPLADTFTA